MSIATIGAVAAADTELLIPGVPQIPYALLLTGAGGTTEVIEVRSLQRGGHVYVTRGAFGSLPVAHTAPVVVTLYDPNSGGGGGGVTPMTGAFVQTTSIPNYDQDKIAFDLVNYDSDSFWVPASKRMVVPAGKGGLYLITAYVGLILSGAPDNPPQFEVDISNTDWNFDPLLMALDPRFSANQYVGSVSMPISVNEACQVWVEGIWSGAPTGEIVMSGLSMFQLGTLS